MSFTEGMGHFDEPHHCFYTPVCASQGCTPSLEEFIILTTLSCLLHGFFSVYFHNHEKYSPLWERLLVSIEKAGQSLHLDKMSERSLIH